jgi:hypothetical protein
MLRRIREERTMTANPATLTVFIVVVTLVLLGVVILGAALRSPTRENICRADGCGHKNPAAAAYCARCGAKLADQRR